MDKPTYSQVLKALCMRCPELVKRDGTVNHNELARQTGIPQPTITRQLNGEVDYPRGKTAERLCRFFKVSADQLAGNQIIPDLFAGEEFQYPFATLTPQQRDDIRDSETRAWKSFKLPHPGDELSPEDRAAIEDEFRALVLSMTNDQKEILVSMIAAAVSPAGSLRLAEILIGSALSEIEQDAEP